LRHFVLNLAAESLRGGQRVIEICPKGRRLTSVFSRPHLVLPAVIFVSNTGHFYPIKFLLRIAACGNILAATVWQDKFGLGTLVIKAGVYQP